MQLRAFILVALAGVLLPAANVAANPTVRLVDGETHADQADIAALEARRKCSDVDYIDIKFDYSGKTFAICANVFYQTWLDASTPSFFSWCGTESFLCDRAKYSGVCNMANVLSCEVASQYCASLGGNMYCFPVVEDGAAPVEVGHSRSE
ncbi:predicted protein [Postia placenta Mad-698-R]|nr:predicted protein [Postia placenta Mad-698-R]